MYFRITLINLILNLLPCFTLDFDDVNAEDVQSRRVSGFGSHTTTARQFPFLVNLKLIYAKEPPGFSYSCSGSIVHPIAVLTAAHCVTRPNVNTNRREYASIKGSYVIVGHKPAFAVALERVDIAPDFDYSWIGDVALLRTTKPMVGPGLGGQIIPMGRSLALPKDPTPVTLIGYGQGGLQSSSVVLKFGEMYWTKTEVCRLRMPDETWASDDNRYVCLTSFDVQSLHGDSGGPIIHQGKLIGVVKGGLTPSIHDYDSNPRGFQRYIMAESVAYYKQWIQSHLPLKESGTSRDAEEISNGDNCKFYSQNGDTRRRNVKGIPVHADGNTTVVYPIGDTNVMFPSGNTTVVHENGRTTVVRGDGSTILLNPDASTVEVSPDGDITVRNSLGNTNVSNSNGKMTVAHENGKITVVNSDGSTTLIQPDGNETTVNSDGTIKVVNSDGSSTTIHPDGTKTSLQPDGSVIVDNERPVHQTQNITQILKLPIENNKIRIPVSVNIRNIVHDNN